MLGSSALSGHLCAPDRRIGMKCDHCHILQLHAAACRQRRQLEAVQRRPPGLPGFASMNMMSLFTAFAASLSASHRATALVQGATAHGQRTRCSAGGMAPRRAMTMRCMATDPPLQAACHVSRAADSTLRQVAAACASAIAGNVTLSLSAAPGRYEVHYCCCIKVV